MIVAPGALEIRMNEVTRILSAVEHGDAKAAAALLPLVYTELRSLAAQRLSHESPRQIPMKSNEVSLSKMMNADLNSMNSCFCGR